MEYIIPIITVFAGAFLGYLVAFTNEKAKNRALIQDISRITAEKEAVVIGFNLEHDRRKHQYERKHEVYSRYHNLLDKFDSEAAILDKKKTEALVSETLNGLYKYRDNEAEQIKVINHLGDQFSQLVREAFYGLKEIGVQTNEIKLVGSPEINAVLDKLNKNYQKVTEISEMLFSDSESLIRGEVNYDPILNSMKDLRDDTDRLKENCIQLMKLDLDKI